MTNFSKYHHLAWLLLVPPIYIFLFVKLGVPHIRLWDEGWFTVHAIEMWQNGSWFVSYFNGEPSFISSKPPLQTWLQITSLQFFGISELTLRLPSAIASAMSVLLIYSFGKRNYTTEFGLVSAAVLLTSIGFIGFHTSRGAEADAFLTLTLIIQAFTFFEFLQSKKWKWMVGFAIALVASFWTKSVAGFLMLPGYLIYALIFDSSSITLLAKSWQFYVLLVAMLVFIAGYVVIRETNQPGYISMFFKSNIGRYTKSVGHSHSFSYYLNNMLRGRYTWWFALFVLGVVMVFMQDARANSLVAFTAICAVSYLLVISISKSKLDWYDMPFYPMASIPVAFTIKTLSKNFMSRTRQVLLVAVLILPTYHMFSHTQAMALNDGEMNFESQEIFLNRAYNRGDDMNNVIIIHDHFQGALIFYRHKFQTRNQALVLQNQVHGLSVGDKVLVRNEAHKKEIINAYHLKQLDAYKTAVLFSIEGKKSYNHIERKSNE